ncbi:exopolysaccharide biosynthesis protein VpsJ [Vibrio cholerae]|uniref:exopolysaccharide biosynthesis protein VpsJ n=1 Tax=Vibrio cholerae TaxID=666 RepID=UPI0005B3AF46|nr:exopolysaccharide biosynthesis protein VpsJ [Vibrio cholerae]EGQ8093962.1 aspartate-semialdehyde dehydrogenase [Vibrio cholerae]ELH5150242.1 exopolysaccharide biosynthesis protein VpsJ [Vibrio cholerae]MCD1191257.1 aspartate-semialdehyde dehydrogenase [Vibrio cholerae]QKU86355.1 aspartate-semialdehyde dehydrogenase [Vibrio cholerae]QKU89824.1 aspartate-semialdehyde dehydrogenase [Vibrio cholerae]
MKSTTVADISQCLLNKARTEQFAGYDPFDGLNSSWFKRLPISKDSTFGLAWIQLFKRSPINLRPWLGVPKARNPKGVALFILGLIEEYQVTKDPALLTEAEQLAQWLVTQRCDEQIWHGACWGYHFDWKARAFFVPKGKPNVITTVYVSRALHQLGQLTGRADWVDLALRSGDFIAGHLLTQNESGEFFAYIPGETAFVHNASLWAAAWLAVVGRETSCPDYTELALRIARNSVQAQAADGSWAYGTRHHHGFIDGFHTGYNLEALHLIRTTLTTNEFDEAIARGFHFYKQHLFEADGTAKYYYNNPYPLDPHSVSQAIITLLSVGGEESDVVLVKRVIQRAIQTLYMPERDQFVYQRNKRWVNRIHYARWTQAWMYFSFRFYLRITNEE